MSSGFVTESELEERKRKRQEEWEKVRQAEDPLNVPEEPYDNRSLFDRLQEQKDKKQLEWDEAHKFKNQIRGIDSEEADFLDQVDTFRAVQERRRIQEEQQTLQEFRKSQAKLLEEEEMIKRQQNQTDVTIRLPKATDTKNKQATLLKAAVVKGLKRPSETPQPSAGAKKPTKEEPAAGLGALLSVYGSASSSDSDED